jgi:hypothetical protein
VTFFYTPDEPDDADPTGMSEDEYFRLTDALASLGAEDYEFERVTP